MPERIDRYAQVLIWAAPLWAGLLFIGTIDHQPSPQTAFADYARFTTTTRFLLGHIFASIVGAGIGNIGFAALLVLLVRRGAGSLALVALLTATLGNTVITSVFGAAAFAQPAIGRLYLAGETSQAMALQDDVYGLPLNLTAFSGILLLTAGLILFGIAVARSEWLPRWAGVGLVVSGPLFAIVGVLLADIVQSIGAVGLFLSTAWIAMRANSAEASPARA